MIVGPTCPLSPALSQFKHPNSSVLGSPSILGNPGCLVTLEYGHLYMDIWLYKGLPCVLGPFLQPTNEPTHCGDLYQNISWNACYILLLGAPTPKIFSFLQSYTSLPDDGVVSYATTNGLLASPRSGNPKQCPSTPTRRDVVASR